jgi:hypothetical protein
MNAQRSNDTLTLGAIVVVALAIIGLSVFIGMQLAPRPEATVIREVVVVTATAAQPTATSEPTATAAPTATPQATLLAQEGAQYFTSLLTPLENITTGLTEIGRLFGDPQFSDSTWKAEAAAALAFIEWGYDGIVALRPPPARADYHRRLIQKARLCRDAVPLIVDGVDNLNSSALREAGSLMQQCGEGMTELGREVQP